MKFLKKLIPVCLLALALVVGITLLTPKAQAATSGTCGDNLTWTLDDAGVLTISGTGAMTNYSLDSSGPGASSTHPWKNIADSIKSVVIDPGITSIGKHAFAGCTSLTSVTIPDGITSLGGPACGGCTSLTSITIPDSVTTIGADAFRSCTSLTSITIGDSVTTIIDYAFFDCTSLTDVYYAGSQTQWSGISIGSRNGPLTSANIHYNHTHNYTLIPPVTVDPTCTEAGYIEYTCMYGETYRETLPALGHSKGEAIEVVAPTCTQQGGIRYTCARCGENFTSDDTPALGHDFNGETTVVAPTCIEQGYSIVQCTRCDETEKTNYTPALGHNVVVIQLRDATCTEPGVSKIGTMCDRCQEVFVEPTYTPALGHSYVDGFCTNCQESEYCHTNGHNFVEGVCTNCPAKDPDYVLPGDLTGDNYLNNADVMALMWYILFPELYPLT